MRVVIAPDSFKDCRPADQIAAAIAIGVRRADPQAEVIEVPLADGGQGTVNAMVRATAGEFRYAKVTGPLGAPVEGGYGVTGDGKTFIIEMAAASGLELLRAEQRNPLVTTTRGTGELIRAALDQGAERILIGIGGSATNDGGTGMAQALGYRLLDSGGNEIGPGGGALDRLDRIDSSARHPRLGQVIIEAACDVTNPLTGPEGASRVFGPQKGGTAETIARLDANLGHFAAIVERDLGVEIDSIPGAGAAGGLGGGLVAFCNAKLRRGIELVIDAVRLHELLAGADLCITGEGALDHSSQFGKTAVGVAALGKEIGVPVVAIAGSILEGARASLDKGVVAYFDATPRPCTLADAIKDIENHLADAAEQVVRLYQCGRNSSTNSAART